MGSVAVQSCTRSVWPSPSSGTSLPPSPSSKKMKTLEFWQNYTVSGHCQTWRQLCLRSSWCYVLQRGEAICKQARLEHNPHTVKNGTQLIFQTISPSTSNAMILKPVSNKLQTLNKQRQNAGTNSVRTRRICIWSKGGQIDGLKGVAVMGKVL